MTQVDPGIPPDAPFNGRACATAVVVIFLGTTGFTWYESSVDDATRSPIATTRAAAAEAQGDRVLPGQHEEVLFRERLLRQDEQDARRMMVEHDRLRVEAEHDRLVREELDAQRDRRLDYLDRVDSELSGMFRDNESTIAEILERVRVLEEWREQALCHAAIINLQSPPPEVGPVAVIPDECAEYFPLPFPPPADTDDASGTATEPSDESRAPRCGG